MVLLLRSLYHFCARLDAGASMRLLPATILIFACAAAASPVAGRDGRRLFVSADMEGMLPRDVMLARAFSRPPGMMRGIDESFAGAIFVGSVVRHPVSAEP